MHSMVEGYGQVITGPRDTLVKARRLRQDMSLPEILLWKELRKRPGGFKFRRRHPAGYYILDFYCAAARLAIEVDGWGHASADARRKDEVRSAYLRSQKVATLRIPAKAVLDGIESAVLRIVEVCEARLPAEREARSPEMD